jgi:hypothetical protein
VQDGRTVTKTVTTFLATWKPAGGMIRVVLVREGDSWLALLCPQPTAAPAEILEAAADRGAIEQTFKNVKEVWGAGQKQVRNLHRKEGCFNLNLRLYSSADQGENARAVAASARRSRLRPVVAGGAAISLIPLDHSR